VLFHGGTAGTHFQSGSDVWIVVGEPGDSYGICRAWIPPSTRAARYQSTEVLFETSHREGNAKIECVRSCTTVPERCLLTNRFER
jgi:hypothetical protein